MLSRPDCHDLQRWKMFDGIELVNRDRHNREILGLRRLNLGLVYILAEKYALDARLFCEKKTEIKDE